MKHEYAIAAAARDRAALHYGAQEFVCLVGLVGGEKRLDRLDGLLNRLRQTLSVSHQPVVILPHG